MTCKEYKDRDIVYQVDPLELEEFKPNPADYPRLPELEKNADGYLQFAYEADIDKRIKELEETLRIINAMVSCGQYSNGKYFDDSSLYVG